MASDYKMVPIVPRLKGEIVAHCIVTLIVLVVVGLRLLGRVRGIGLGWDDGLIVLATLMSITLLVMEGVWAGLGEGHNLIPTEPYFAQLMANTPQILKMLIGFTLVYLQALTMIKCSALAFYLRMFPTPRMQILIKFSLGMTVVWAVAHDLALIFLCSPVQYQWDRTIAADKNPTCGNQLALYTSVVTTNIVSDFWIMALPMYTIWHLKMRSAEKVALTLCFLLGLGTVGLSTARLVNLYNIRLSTNLTGTMDVAVLLGIFEVNFGILAVSIPLLRPFYRRYKQKMSSSRLNEGTGDRDRFKDPEASASAGSRNFSKPGNNKKGSRYSKSNVDKSSVIDETWEMGDYTTAHANVEHSTEDMLDDRGSEKRLTSTSKLPSQISVRTDWTVSRN